MVFQIVISGESQCEKFAQVCLIADYLAQNLPNFCYRRIEKPVLEWKTWLCKINQKYNWHHVGSLLIWKELLMEGSKAYYIGGAPDFFDYCYSYYKFDTFLVSERFQGLVKNFAQLQKKQKRDQQVKYLETEPNYEIDTLKKRFIACISGAAHPLTMHLISGLLDTSYGQKGFSKIYIHDKQENLSFLEFVERECNYIGTNNPTKVVKCVEKLGMSLTNSDLLIVLEHVPFNKDLSIGGWLYKNTKLMENLAFMINASASPKIRIIIPNLGPACFNATVLKNSVTNIKKSNIVVSTSDLGLEIASTVAKIAEVPMRNMFCPPVWGFVGINHLVDIRTTIHKYNYFDALNRFARVRNSTLCIGKLTPEMRTMEYLMYFDESLWLTIAEKNDKNSRRDMSKAIALINVVKLWFFDSDPNQIISLGIQCDGSYGLSFDGFFSQPAHFVGGEWKIANTFLMPRDPQINILYLEEMARLCMQLGKHDLPHNLSAE
ncbi:putative malate dehydrogenase 1B [Epargyreus clarus]|uniref:putative malate dehydrogenase 1B n=1 Tax=Epargyreus clarus TaxID=520877 RepID=UPI003C2E16B5